jgi:hypothetical protein
MLTHHDHPAVDKVNRVTPNHIVHYLFIIDSPDKSLYF